MKTLKLFINFECDASCACQARDIHKHLFSMFYILWWCRTDVNNKIIFVTVWWCSYNALHCNCKKKKNLCEFKNTHAHLQLIAFFCLYLSAWLFDWEAWTIYLSIPEHYVVVICYPPFHLFYCVKCIGNSIYLYIERVIFVSNKLREEKNATKAKVFRNAQINVILYFIPLRVHSSYTIWGVGCVQRSIPYD